jgi:ribosomal protein L35
MGYKLKTHSSAKKRFKATGSAHILTKQTTKRKRHNRGMIKMADETKKIAQKLLYNI